MKKMMKMMNAAADGGMGRGANARRNAHAPMSQDHGGHTHPTAGPCRRPSKGKSRTRFEIGSPNPAPHLAAVLIGDGASHPPMSTTRCAAAPGSDSSTSSNGRRTSRRKSSSRSCTASMTTRPSPCPTSPPRPSRRSCGDRGGPPRTWTGSTPSTWATSPSDCPASSPPRRPAS